MEEWKKYFKFMATDEWVVFINIIRVLTFIFAIGLIIWLWKEIEAVKLLAYDPCKICMSKTDSVCFINPKFG